jgi:NTP pyrophosphatase (non-canonical NTP hydrolase)
MSIKEVQDHVKELRERQGWHDTSLEHRIMFLVTELGEVVQETLKFIEAHSKNKKADLENIRDSLGMEIYDVMVITFASGTPTISRLSSTWATTMTDSRV